MLSPDVKVNRPPATEFAMLATQTAFQTLPAAQLAIAAALLIHWLSPPVDHPVRRLWAK
jgi:hypothetical protein